MENRRARESANTNKAGIILGSMMVLSSMLMIITRFSSLEVDGVVLSVDDGVLGIISRFMLLAGGIIILAFRNKGNYFAIGVYAMTLGLSRFLRTLPNLVSESDVMFNVAIFITLLSANLAATGYNHLTVRMKNPLTMRYTTLLIITAYVVVLLYFAYIHQSPTLIMEYLPDMIWYIPLYLSLLLVLYSKEVVDNSPMGRIMYFSGEVARKVDIGGPITVSEEDAEKIRDGFRGPEGWSEKSVNGRCVREETVTFRTGKGDRDVVLERREGDGDLLITVIDDRTDSFVNGYRMKASSYSESDGAIRLVDAKGVCAVLHVRGSE